jgi:mono/diheme cytochrome c family protein
VGAFKRNAKILKQPFTYHSEEAGVVGIPNLMDKGFRSSYTIDGAYGVAGKPRYKSITKEEARDPQHLNEMSRLAAFFTYSAMGNSLNNVEPNIPKVEKIFATFVRDLKPHKFPGQIDRLKASRGEQIYKQSCSGCHGIYSEGLDNIELQSFPNKQVPQAVMGSDPYRWKGIDQSIVDFSNQNVFAKYIDAGKELGGYTAPILTGIWFKAPYLHNGSVPTLWQLLNPELRPKKFLMGGHAIDMVDVGIKGELNALGEYVYPSSYTPWSQPAMFDTSESGKSNLGHEKMFEKLNSNEKRSVLEYLKLL